MTINLAGFDVLIDDEDYERVSTLKWFLNKPEFKHKGNAYFGHNFKYKDEKFHTGQLHRYILGLELYDGRIVDHMNGDTLDNRKCNLRICTNTENCQNAKKRKDNTTGFKGVTYDKNSNRYKARIQVDRHRILIGMFSTPEEAHIAYCEASKKYHGEFGRTE